MKKFILVLLLFTGITLVAFNSSADSSPKVKQTGRCEGSKNCSACKSKKDCSACKHCKKEGGTCGKCSK